MNREERIAAMGAVANPKMLTTAEFVAYMTRALGWFAEDHADTPDALESTRMIVMAAPNKVFLPQTLPKTFTAKVFWRESELSVFVDRKNVTSQTLCFGDPRAYVPLPNPGTPRHDLRPRQPPRIFLGRSLPRSNAPDHQQRRPGAKGLRIPVPPLRRLRRQSDAEPRPDRRRA
jgi:hypothetical protein